MTHERLVKIKCRYEERVFDGFPISYVPELIAAVEASMPVWHYPPEVPDDSRMVYLEVKHKRSIMHYEAQYSISGLCWSLRESLIYVDPDAILGWCEIPPRPEFVPKEKAE